MSDQTSIQSTHTILHRLWTWAVGKDGYVKSEWVELSNRIERLERAKERRAKDRRRRR